MISSAVVCIRSRAVRRHAIAKYRHTSLLSHRGDHFFGGGSQPNDLALSKSLIKAINIMLEVQWEMDARENLAKQRREEILAKLE